MDFRTTPPVTGGLAQAAVVVDGFDIEDELNEDEIEDDAGDDNAA